MDIIGALCSIIGVAFLIYQFSILPRKETANMRIVLLSQFKSAQSMVDKLINDVEEYAFNNNSLDKEFTPYVSFRLQIKHLIEIREQSLSEELYSTLKVIPLNKELYDAMIASLQEQILSFHKASAHFNKFKFS